MALGSESRHGMWSSRWLFVLAAAGSAVGLGNIWKFPYIVGEHGGGAFVLLYLACILLIGVPIMMSETLLGRAGRASPINTMRKLTSTHGGGKFWVAIGWMGVLAGLLILSYYAVIAGWALFYIWRMASGSFDGATPEFAQASFASFQAEPLQMIAWQTIFMILTIYIVGRGVIKGLEAAIRWFMPLLFILLIVLLGYSSQSSGFGEAVDFMFRFNWQSLTPDAVLVAMGQAFFTLSLGHGHHHGLWCLPARQDLHRWNRFHHCSVRYLGCHCCGLGDLPDCFCQRSRSGFRSGVDVCHHAFGLWHVARGRYLWRGVLHLG